MLLNEKDHSLIVPTRKSLVLHIQPPRRRRKQQPVSRIKAGGMDTRMLTDADLGRVPLEVFSAAIKQHILQDAETAAVKRLSNYAGENTPETLENIWKNSSEQAGANWSGNFSEYLCALRTGCIGALAIDAMAATTAKSLAVIGTGKHAETHLLAALLQRDFEDIRLYGRRPVAANDLAKLIRSRTSATIRISTSPEEAVHHADVVLLVTNSGEPTVDADWVSPEAHVSTIGPKTKNHHEVPAGILRRAKLIASDDPQQITDQIDPAADDKRTKLRVRHLGNLIEKFDPNYDRAMTLFVSSGLGGTEKIALKAAIDFLDHS